MAELCGDCGVADSNGIPCYMMFRKDTNIEICSRYVKDPEKHEQIVTNLKQKKEERKKAKAAAAEGGDK